MRKHTLYVLIALCSLSFRSLSAQIVAFENPEAELQRARIGLVDEFMKRFNGQESHPDLKPAVCDSINRNLLWLFDQEQFMNESQQRQDSIRTEILNLIEVIDSDSVKLNYSDTTWTAIAHCKGLLFGKPEKFDVFLTVQARGDDMYKWVVNAVEGDCFNISPKNASDNIIISPDAHETKFISLNRIAKEQPRNIKLFLSKNMEYDQTSVFAYLVYSGKLKIEYVERLEFIFLQVPGYAFHIQYFDRQSNNSGWLISNFYRFSDSEKASFRKMINQVEPLKQLSYEFIEHTDSTECASDSIYTCMPDTRRVNKLFADRIKERVKTLQDYVSFIGNDNNDMRTKEFYAQKLLGLFSSDAKTIIRNNKTGNTKIVDIKKFVDGILCHKFKDFVIDAVSSVVIRMSDSDEVETNVIGTGIIPISVAESVETLNTICDKMLRIEDTEDGGEFLCDFGNLYITTK